jgi:hypothetical protein
MRRTKMRPIDADAIPYTMLYKENWIEGTGREEQGVWKSDIDKMPTIEPKCADGCLYDFGSDECEGCLFTTVKPKRGRWLEKKDFIYCSECGDGFDAINKIDYRYCPNCGARMEE